ncbi:MAG: TonB-dependent receptor plug domain-containing protein [Bacteroides sp.]|nr:TonB-dependent receptor plug domain-containing protein [Bacteroides sp.]
MDRYKLLLHFLLGFVEISLQAQTRVITGEVTDEYEEPLVGVTVTTPDRMNGTVTGIDGYYRLEIPASVFFLLFSCVGYESREVSLDRSHTLKVTLSENNHLLNELVVVGYGVQRRKDVTGSIVSMKPDKIETMPAVNIAQMLQGKLPGLHITNEASSASGAVTIRIRAQNSITAGTAPLIVVDGIEYSEGLAHLNPLDVESVDVLKDASSSAIYGAKAANGVILITTKRSVSGKTSVAFSAIMGIQKATNLPDMMNSETFYRFKEERLGYVSAFDTRQYEKGVDTNWLKHTLRTGHTQDYSLSFSGGSEQTRYYISGNLARIEGTPRNDDFNRHNLRINFDTKLAS